MARPKSPSSTIIEDRKPDDWTDDNRNIDEEANTQIKEGIPQVLDAFNDTIDTFKMKTQDKEGTPPR